MWYAPYLRARRAIVVYALFVIAITAISIAVRFSPGVHVNESAQDTRDIANFYADLHWLAAGASAFVAGLATVLGLSLAAENSGHLELVWTRPTPRERYALGLFGVDFAAMVVAQVVTMLCALLSGWIWTGHEIFTFDARLWWMDAGALLFPVYVYAWIVVLTASLKRNRGAVSGLFWPAMLFAAAARHIPVPAVRAAAGVVDAFNPLVMFSSSDTSQPAAATYALAAAATVVLLGVALVQWRRLEA